MVTLGRLIFKATGVMSNRGLVKNSRKIGEKIVETMQKSGGKIETAEVQKIVEDTVGKKAAGKIKFLDSKEAIREYSLKQGIASEENLEVAFEKAFGFNSPAKYSRNSAVFINKEKIAELLATNLNTGKMVEGTCANTFTHEIQHALTTTSGKQNLYLLKGKFAWGRKLIDKKVAKFNQYGLQKKYVNLQEDLINLSTSGIAVDANTVREMLYSKGILTAGENKKNAFILKELSKTFKGEVRSWTVGNAAHEMYLGQKLPNSQTAIDIFESLAKGTSKELKHVRANRIKSFFGIKPKSDVPIAKSEPVSFAKVENSKNIFD